MADNCPVARRQDGCPVCKGTVYILVELIGVPCSWNKGPTPGRIAGEAYCPGCRSRVGFRADYKSLELRDADFDAKGFYPGIIEHVFNLFVEHHKEG